MAGGPDKSVKMNSAGRDISETLYDSWFELARNLLIIAIVSICTWALVSVVRFGIELCYDATLGVFAEAAEAGVEEGRAVESAKLDFSMWIVMGVLVAGAIIRTLLLSLPSWRSSVGDGMGEALGEIHASYEESSSEVPARYQKPDFMHALRRVILTILTVGSGGSGGIEAPVVPIGESIGAAWSRLFGVIRREDVRLFQIAGIAAAISTLLDAPFTAAVFAAEVVYHGRVLYRTLTYSLIAAVIGFALNNHFFEVEALFSAPHHPHNYTPVEYMEIAAVAFVCSTPAALLLAWLFSRLRFIFSLLPFYTRSLAGAIGAGAVAVCLWFWLGIGPQHILGVSEETIVLVLTGMGESYLQLWWVLLLLILGKLLATAFTLVSGGSAGLLVPAMYIGAVTGAAVYQILFLLGYEPSGHISLYVVSGLSSALVAVAHVPLSAIALVLEVFGAAYGPPAIVACVFTYMLSRRYEMFRLGNSKEKE
ncbi:MAG: chloride channel protein [Gammaproteobacteria bacterium]|nr:chloride channel protein [Gammaproteobacteria bacterium]